MAAEQNSQNNVDMMDDFTLFRFNQIIKEKANMPPGKTPTLILTDSSGKRRLSFGNLGQLQEIREQKALIDAGSDISLSPSEEKDIKETEGECPFYLQDTKQIKIAFDPCQIGLICDTFALFLISEATKEEVPTEPKQEYDLQFEGKIKFKSDFHRHMHKFSEAHSFSVFMLLVIVANCGILIAMTFEVVVVRGGMN